jgi:nitroreductase
MSYIVEERMDTRTVAELVAQRYGSAELPLFEENPTLATLLQHRSVRAYTAEPLPETVLPTLVAAAQSAATSSNLQAWSVVAVQEPERKARLAQLAGEQAHIRECPLFLVWLADLSRLERLAVQRELPHAGLDYMELFMLGIIDAALAAQNAVIAAESLGLGIVYIGAIRNRPLDVVAELQLPPRVFPVFGLCVGWPDPARPTAIKPRLPQAAVLHREVYSTAQEDAAVAEYNQAMDAFYKEQGMRVRGDWTAHSVNRVAGPQSLSGRHVIREALEQLGFALR